MPKLLKFFLLFFISEGISNYFTLKIHHGGIFTKSPGRRYVDGTIDYVDFVDIDVFSVHELDTMVREIGYVEGQTLYYHFLIPEVELDFGLLPLGNDGDVHVLSNYVEKNNLLSIYIEHGHTRVNSYFVVPHQGYY